MESIINNIKVAIITVPETFNFDLPIKVENTLKHKNHYVKKHDGFLAKITKNEITQLLFKYKHRNEIHENGKQ